MSIEYLEKDTPNSLMTLCYSLLYKYLVSWDLYKVCIYTLVCGGGRRVADDVYYGIVQEGQKRIYYIT